MAPTPAATESTLPGLGIGAAPAAGAPPGMGVTPAAESSVPRGMEQSAAPEASAAPFYAPHLHQAKYVVRNGKLIAVPVSQPPPDDDAGSLPYRY